MSKKSGCGTEIAMFILGVLSNAIMVYAYFWGLNDDSLFSTDYLWRTVILWAWIFEICLLLFIAFNVFTGRRW